MGLFLAFLHMFKGVMLEVSPWTHLSSPRVAHHHLAGKPLGLPFLSRATGLHIMQANVSALPYTHALKAFVMLLL